MESNNLLGEGGIIITLGLIILPVVAALLIVIYKIYGIVDTLKRKKELERFKDTLKGLSPQEIQQLEQRKKELGFVLSNNELAGNVIRSDRRGLIDNISSAEEIRFVEKKKKSQPRPYIEPPLTKLILWFLGCAVFWLLFGTTIGEYVGIKFVAPDVDHISWLSFGRLRPVHTNSVFWGWASMAMMGLAYYVVPRISNTALANIKMGYYSLILSMLRSFLEP